MKRGSRRVISALLSFVLLFSLLPVSVFAADSDGTQTAAVSVDTVSAAPGSTVQVAVRVKDNPGILGAKLTFEYDDGLTLIDAKAGEAFSVLTMTKPGRFESPCAFVWDGQEIGDEDVRDGVILTLTFEVASDSTGYEHRTIRVSCGSNDFVDRDLQPMRIDLTDGGVSVISYIPGDVNMDGEVLPVDIVQARRYLAGGYSQNIYVPAIDVNADAELTPVDIILIRRFVAGGYGVVLKPSPLANIKECAHELEAIAYQAPTCTEPGNDPYWKCTLCGKLFSDAEGSLEITADSTLIDAMGHTPNSDGTKCTVCGAILSDMDDGKEYTISFYCPLAPQQPIKRKITDRTPISDPENMNQYVFMGWTDADGNVVTEVEPGTKDITLYANWISHRNQTISNDYEKKGPIILEDEEKGQILFVYDIGKIINVPLYTIKDFGNTTSGIITKESESVTKSISSTTVDTITKTIVDATTDSATWTLSKEWNDMVTNTEDFSETDLKESSILISDGYAHTGGTTTNTGTVTDGGTLTKNNTTIKDLTTTKDKDTYDLGFEAGIGTSEKSPVQVNFKGSVSRGGENETTNEDGTIKDEGTDEYNLTHTNNLTTTVDQTTTSHLQESQSKIAQEITKQWHYSIAKSTGETSGESKTSDISHSDSESVSSSFSYTVMEETTNVKEYSTEKAVPGYHRLVCAGTVHVFAVVGFDIASHSYYYYSYNVLDDETHEFWDYSKNNAEYIDLDRFSRLLHSYTISLDANGGTCNEATLERTPGVAVGTLPVPAREGFTFLGWFTGKEGGAQVTETTVFSGTDDITLYAHWEANAYTVSWRTGTGYQIAVSRTASPYGGGTLGGLANGAAVYYGDVLKVSYSAATGYSLGATGATEITVAGSVTESSIYASASPNSYTYTILYRSTNGTDLGSSTATYIFGTTQQLSAPAKSGYNTPASQTVVWDATSKTITFYYSPSWVGSTTKTGTAVSSPKITYSATVEYRNRTASSVEFRVIWTATIVKNGYDAYGQRFNATCGSSSTGAVEVVKFGAWANSSTSARSSTGTSGWVRASVNTTNATSLSIGVYYYQVNSNGTKMGSDMSTTWQVPIPAY